MVAILVFLALIGVLALSAARLALLLIYFQQEEYDGPRFLRWVGANRATDITFSAAAALIAAGMALGVRLEFGFGFIAVAGGGPARGGSGPPRRWWRPPVPHRPPG